MNMQDLATSTGIKHSVKIHRPEDFEGMRKAGRLAAELLDFITPYVKPGVSTGALDRLCHEFTLDHGAVPAPLNYRDFPKSICTSVNRVVCHGIPDNEQTLREGDIVNIDVTPILDGWYGDSSRMFPVGEIKVMPRRLIDVTHAAMMKGIEVVRPGAKLSEVGKAIQAYVEAERFSVVEDFCGHGLGRIFHDAPSVLHYAVSRLRKSRIGANREVPAYPPEQDLAFEEGMFLTIEPMVNAGSPEVFIMRDGWTAVTRDKKLSAQFEHTLGVTAQGVEIFTLSPKGLHLPPYD
ncbi:MAG: type I methionyl aminopeptidase [Alphaproteobacteria bacterium]